MHAGVARKSRPLGGGPFPKDRSAAGFPVLLATWRRGPRADAVPDDGSQRFRAHRREVGIGTPDSGVFAKEAPRREGLCDENSGRPPVGLRQIPSKEGLYSQELSPRLPWRIIR